jgi:polyisoprenoid-binding protein YceI
MLRNGVIIIGAVVLVVVAAVAVFLFRPPEEASGPIEAVPLATVAATATSGATATPAASATAMPEATQPATAVESTPEAAPTDVADTASEPVVFAIVAGESQASFSIDEVLRGEPVTVVGVTDQVAGQLSLDPARLQDTQVGVITINARTLETDNEFRNRAIKNAILLTNDYEFISFTPNELRGLPDNGVVGETYSFEMSGDLTITDVTRPVTFVVEVTPVSATRIEGTASASVLYQDFELRIPDSPSVDTVDDEVRLELRFAAESSE